MKKKELFELNEKLVNENKDKYMNFQNGFFKGNHLLILNLKANDSIDQLNEEDYIKLIKNQLNEEDYIKLIKNQLNEEDYIKLIKKTKIGEFITGLCGGNYNHISFTNIYKHNSSPSQHDIEILNQQIELLNPNLIICLGDEVGKIVGIVDRNKFMKKGNNFYLLINDDNTARSINFTKMLVDTHFKMNAIVRVTNRKIYYRDSEFKKVSYKNNEDDSQCFIEIDNRETPYKSFDGKKLIKVTKSEEYKKTYEGHLKKKDLFYYNHIQNLTHSKMIRTMLLDIETNYCNDVMNTPKEITAISFWDSLEDKYYVLVLNNKKKEEVNRIEGINIITFDNERNLLETFLRMVDKFDVVSGWYSNDFDVPYIFNRSKLLGIELTNWFENIFIKTENNQMFIYSDSIVFFDSLQFYREKASYYSKPPSYSLGAVGQFLLGESKLEHTGLEDLWDRDINMLVKYNLQDVKLLKKIVELTNTIQYPLELQQICPQDFENVYYNSKTIENLLHHRYWYKNIFFPTKVTHHKPEIEGAIVLDPTKGIHNNVAVFDFSAMYTQIIMSFNLSTEMLVGEKKYVEDNFDMIVNDLKSRYEELNDIDIRLEELVLIKNDFGEFYFIPKNWKQGILPLLEEEMIEGRIELQRIRDTYEEGSALYKVYDSIQGTRKQILNSIFGVNGYNKFILFDPRVASSILSVAREMILWSKEVSESHGFKVLYSDTDSAFISLGENLEFDEFISRAKELEKTLNTSLYNFMGKFTKNQSVISTHGNRLEFEKAYSKLFLLDVKKRYFGKLKFYKGKVLEKEKMSTVGVETRRADTPVYFNDVLMKVYELFLEDNYNEKLRKYYKEIKKSLKEISHEDLVIKIKLSRDKDSYSSVPIHVRALNNSNTDIRRGESIRMIYVKDSREVLHYDPTLNLKFEVDYEKYLENFFINKVHLVDNSIKFHPTLFDYGL